eukprot:763724-Hanusia_phi.AAC.6
MDYPSVAVYPPNGARQRDRAPSHSLGSLGGNYPPIFQVPVIFLYESTGADDLQSTPYPPSNPIRKFSVQSNLPGPRTKVGWVMTPTLETNMSQWGTGVVNDTSQHRQEYFQRHRGHGAQGQGTKWSRGRKAAEGGRGRGGETCNDVLTMHDIALRQLKASGGELRIRLAWL